MEKLEAWLDADPSDREALIRAVDHLPERWRMVIEWRFGFNGEPRTLRAIAEDLGVTGERVRHLEERALARIAAEVAEHRATRAWKR